ncbi:MAG: hypothetical protein ACMVO3_19305 [Thalassobaculum sp.]
MLTENFGADIDGSIGTNPRHRQPGRRRRMAELGQATGFKGDDPYVPEEPMTPPPSSCSPCSPPVSTDSAVYKDHVEKVANAPGEKIYPGELKKALQILADGGDIDYVGGTALELIGPV